MSITRITFAAVFFLTMICFIIFGFQQIRAGQGEGEVSAILYGPILMITFGIALVSGAIAAFILKFEKSRPRFAIRAGIGFTAVLLAGLTANELVLSQAEQAERQRIAAEDAKKYDLARQAVIPLSEAAIKTLKARDFAPEDAPALLADFLQKAEATGAEYWRYIWVTTFTERYFDLYSMTIGAQSQDINVQELMLPFYGSEVCDEVARDFQSRFAAHQKTIFEAACT